MAELNENNFEDWRIWYMTELIGYMPIRDWVSTNRLPNFDLPRRSRDHEVKDEEGKMVTVTV